MNLTSRISDRSSPLNPGSAKSGARLIELLKWTLPRPPTPPLATTTSAPARSRSATSTPSSSRTTVPTGTSSTTSAPPRPVLLPPAPSAPASAFHRGCCLKSERSETPVVAFSRTEPPRPPSPPSGPPRGVKGSRLKEEEPFPPWPPRTTTRTESTNWRRLSVRVFRFELCALRGCADADAPAVLADPLIAHVAWDEREQRVVAAEANARSRRDLGAALPDEDRARAAHLAAVDLHSQHLRVGIAAVAR